MKESLRLGVDVLIVTDHNTIRGSQEVRKLAADGPMLVPIAAEYQTEKGDIIAVFLKEEIGPGSAEEVIRQIHSQRGMLVLPHPFKAHRLDDVLLSEMDIMEIYNSRCSNSENAAAKELAERLGKPFLGGADAHCAKELGAVINHFSGELPRTEEQLREGMLRSPREILSQPVSGVYRPYSQMIKAVKTRNPILFLSQSKRLAATWVRESFRQ